MNGPMGQAPRVDDAAPLLPDHAVFEVHDVEQLIRRIVRVGGRLIARHETAFSISSKPAMISAR
jgi:hypothetical protein